MEHWNGTAWTQVPGPQFYLSVLLGVVDLSPNNAWAVGTYNAATEPALILHWDGITWSQVPCPNPGEWTVLSGVAAVAPDDIWAVGDYWNYPQNGMIIEHWDGIQWSVDLTDTTGSSLFAVSALAANDVWAVGKTPGTSSSETNTLVEHWNGTQWITVPSPNLGSINRLYGVAAISSTDVWAVGDSEAGAITMHWDGSAWIIVPVPGGLQNASLQAVAGRATDDAWAVGTYGIFPGIHTLALHWDGTRWAQAYTPNISPTSAGLNGVATDPDGNAWAVGDYDDSPPKTLVERYRPGDCCQFPFTDVQPGDYFYEAVRHLYCHGAISGYADNTFRPYNNTTRGQLTKIMVLAKVWIIDTSGGPHFSDVPPSNPFYGYIETAYHHGIISGYADGTFRWGNYITRAQLSKVIVVAQQWPIDTSGGPHFSDVPPSNSFYGYIETAYNYGIISGYADGTFRPGNDATRGQISKIVYYAIVQP